MTYKVDIAIIGAGIVGLAVASQIARHNREVVILEKNESFGRESSSRNSGTIHSGVLSPPGSLNARLCVAGRDLVYEICRKYDINYLKCGKLLAANNSRELAELEAIYKRKDEDIQMQWLDQGDIRKLEPEVAGQAGILLPDAGVVDPYGLMCCYLGLARDNDASLICNAEVTGIEKLADGYRLKVREGNGTTVLHAGIVINCAGHRSDKIAAMAGIDINKNGYKLSFLKGEYYNVRTKIIRGMDRRLVYPVPIRGTMCIHTVLDTDRRVRLGPLFYPVDEIDYATDDRNKQVFYDQVKTTFPAAAYDDIDPESAGVMPRLYGIDEPFKEFIIRHEADKGLPGFINLVGIETPGITASAAIGRYVGEMVEEIWKR